MLVTSNFVYRKKRKEFAKKSNDDNIYKKNTATKSDMVRRDWLQSSPMKHLPLTTVKRLQRKIDDTVERSTDNLPVELENEKLLLKKYSIISVTFC